MSVIWSKVWFDLWNRKARTILAVLSIAAGVFAIGAIFGMVDQLLTGMDSAHHAVEPSHMNIILTNFIDEETAQDWLKIPGVVGVEPLNINSVRYKLSPDAPWENGTVVMRDDFDEQSYDFVSLRDGAWPANYNIGIERLSSSFYGLEMGDTVIFEMDGTDRPFTINGKIRHPFVPPPNFGGQAYFFVDADTIVPAKTWVATLKIMQNGIHAGGATVKLDEPETAVQPGCTSIAIVKHVNKITHSTTSCSTIKIVTTQKKVP